nr:hypothetical protein [Tanacetum cinerariifolium]
MGDEHLNTILATKSDEFNKSCVENFVPNPSESKGENGCDVPACFTTFSNILFDADYDFYSSDNQSFSNEDFPKEIYLNPLFDEEIIPMKIDPRLFNAESDLIESMLNHDSSIIISSKIDSLFDEFAGELTLLKSIPSGIDETDCYPEEETHFTNRLLYDNSSPRPPEEFVSDNSNAEIESFSPSPIPVKDSDSLLEEIDLSFNTDDPIPPGIKDDDHDSEREILILNELLSNDSLSLPGKESFYYDIPSFSRPPAKPPDGNTRNLNIKMMGDISEQKVPMPRLTITRVSNQEKSPDLLPHRGLEIFQPSAKCPMMIHRKNTPTLDVLLFYFYPLDQFKIEQYFLMTDYSLWEVILNGDSLVSTRIVEGVVHPVAPTTAKQKLARKNELKARGTLLMALPDKYQLKFNSHKDAKTLMEAIEKRFVSAAVNVSAVGSKLPASPLPNRFLQKTSRNLGANGTVSMGFDMTKVECYNCHKKGYFVRECRSLKDQRSYQAEEEPENFALMAFSSHSSSSSFDNEDTALVTLRQKLEATELDRDDLKLKLENWLSSNLYDRFVPNGGYHAVPPLYTGTFRPPKLDLVFHTAPSDETEHLAFNTQALKVAPSFAQSTKYVKSSRNPGQPLQATIPAVPTVPVRFKTPCHGPRRNKKACFICKSVDHLIKDYDFHFRKLAQRTYASRDTRKQYASLRPSKSHTHVAPTAVLPQSKSVLTTAARLISVALPYLPMTRPRHAYHIVTKSNSPIRRYLPRSPSSKHSNSPIGVTAAKAPVVSAAQGKKGTWVWRPKCPILDHDFQTTSASMTLKRIIHNKLYKIMESLIVDAPRHMTGNISYFLDFEELNGGYVAFGGNPKGGKITGVKPT